MSENKTTLWSEDKTEDDINYHANNDSDNVIFNLLEDITCLNEQTNQLQAQLAESERLRYETIQAWSDKFDKAQAKIDELE